MDLYSKLTSTALLNLAYRCPQADCGQPAGTREALYESHDPVFGVTESLVHDITKLDDRKIAEKCGLPLGTKLMQQDFVLVTDGEAAALRREQAKEVMGDDIQFYENMPCAVVADERPIITL